MSEKRSMSRIKAITEYFGDDPRKVGMAEMRELSTEERVELGDLCLEALGATLTPK